MSLSQTPLPERYNRQLLQLIDELENETGEMYKVSVKGLDYNRPVEIKPFDKRDGYRVYNMAPGYEALEGEYATKQEMTKKLDCLKFADAVEHSVMNDLYKQGVRNPMDIPQDKRLNLQVKYSPVPWNKDREMALWVCPKCKSYERNFDNVCAECSLHIDSHWYYMECNTDNSIVYKGGGGSLSICTPMGYIEIINKTTKGKAKLKTRKASGKLSTYDDFDETLTTDEDFEGKN